MKFILGNPISSANLRLQEEWKKHSHKNDYLNLLIGILLGLLITICLDILITFFGLWNFNFSVIKNLYLLILIIPLHEFIHLIFLPCLSNASIGFSPKKIVFYVATEDEISKIRFLIIVIMPFILLTVLPLIIFFYWRYDFIAQLALLNALASGIDLKSFFYIYKQPKGSVFKMVGSNLYSKII
jgi:hypothetical protein